MSAGITLHVVGEPAVDVQPVDEEVVSVYVEEAVVEVVDLPYAHPVGDGNSHVPATGTTHAGDVLKAGATPGEIYWGREGAYYRDTGEPLGGHRVVAADDAGHAIHADPSNVAHAGRILGMTTGAAGLGSQAEIVRAYEMEEPSWAWTLGSPVFLGAAGVLTQVVPEAPSATFSLIVGFPITPTRLYIHIREPILL